jgi:hypothetical protein
MNFGDIMTRMINPMFGNTSLLAAKGDRKKMGLARFRFHC